MWVNKVLQVGLTKVEQCANGAIYCQLLDACHPNAVAMRKVNWSAKTDRELTANYKVLQAAFDKSSIERPLALESLMAAKYQDNLELLQWIKHHFETKGLGQEAYDPRAAREGKTLPAWASRMPEAGSLGVAGLVAKLNASATGASREASTPKTTKRSPTSPPSSSAASPATAAAAVGGRSPGLRQAIPASSPAPAAAASRTTDGEGGHPAEAAVDSAARKSLAAVPQAAEDATLLVDAAPRSLAEELKLAETEEAATEESDPEEDLRNRLLLQQEDLEARRANFAVLEQERDEHYRKFRLVESLCGVLKSRLEENKELPVYMTPENIVADLKDILCTDSCSMADDQFGISVAV